MYSLVRSELSCKYFHLPKTKGERQIGKHAVRCIADNSSKTLPWSVGYAFLEAKSSAQRLLTCAAWMGVWRPPRLRGRLHAQCHGSVPYRWSAPASISQPMTEPCAESILRPNCRLQSARLALWNSHSLQVGQPAATATCTRGSSHRETL